MSRNTHSIPLKPQEASTVAFEQPSPKDLGQKVTSGLLWSILSASIGKGASLVAQLLLGWLLSKEDFALYAIAISWSTIAMALRNGGTQRLLVQKGQQYDELASTHLKFALLFNAISFLMLIGIAPILSDIYASPELRQMLWTIGLSIPIGSAAMMLQAKLSADLKFTSLARLTICSSILRNASMVIFAWLGFGPLSFVLPLIIVAVTETALGWYWTGSWPPNRPLTWPAMRQILQDSRWVMLTALASALTVNGDYLAISLLQSKAVLGVYFFGFQLSLALVALVTSSLDAVMMPTFSLLSSDLTRQTDLFLRGVRLLALGATFTCFGLAISAQAAIHSLWAGKWDEAIPVVQILSLTMPVRLIIPLCRAILESRGEWKLVSFLSVADGIGIVLAGAIGAWSGDLIAIIAVVSGYNLISGLLYCGIVGLKLMTPLWAIFLPVFSTFGIGAFAVAMGAAPLSLVSPNDMGLWQTIIGLAIYVGTYMGLTKAFMGNSFSELCTLVQRKTSARLI
jgi:PST family polysaccharide transporter